MGRTAQAPPFPAEPESPPPQGPVAYPPAAAQYPPERPVAYPPPAAQQPTPFEPTHYPPQQSQATAYPPEGPVSYPPNPTQYPPKSQPFQQQPSKPTAYPPKPQPAAYPPKSQPFQQQPHQYEAASQHQPPAYHPQWRPEPKPSSFATGTPVTYPALQQVPQPQPQGYGRPVGAEPWTTELFDCMADPNNAIITYFMPCVTFGQIAEILDEGRQPCSTSAMIYALMMSFFGLHFFYSCSYRTKLRAKYNLMEQPLPDALVHYLCGFCALCQEYRELKNRGIDPANGWLGVIQGPPVRMVPPPRQTMYQY